MDKNFHLDELCDVLGEVGLATALWSMEHYCLVPHHLGWGAGKVEAKYLQNIGLILLQ